MNAVLTGYKEIDKVLSRGRDYPEGGFPLGHMVEFFGKDGSGKSTFMLRVIAAAQKQNIKCGYLDVEGSLDEDHADFLGVDISKLDIRSPETGEETISNVLEMLENGVVFIVIDSVAGMVPEASWELEVGSSGTYAPVAQLMAKELPKVRQIVKRKKACVVLVNQIRAKINKFGMGRDYDSYGGWTIKFFVSIRLEIVRVGDLKYSDVVVGQKCKLSAWKNRKAPPKRPAFFNITFDHDAPDVGRRATLIDEGEITKVGGKFKYKGELYTAKTIYEAIKEA